MKYTTFDVVMHNILPFQNEERLENAVHICCIDSLPALLEYAADCRCIAHRDYFTILDGIRMYEDLSGDYWEDDLDKLMLLHEKLGITEEVFNKYKL